MTDKNNPYDLSGPNKGLQELVRLHKEQLRRDWERLYGKKDDRKKV